MPTRARPTAPCSSPKFSPTPRSIPRFPCRRTFRRTARKKTRGAVFRLGPEARLDRRRGHRPAEGDSKIRRDQHGYPLTPYAATRHAAQQPQDLARSRGRRKAPPSARCLAQTTTRQGESIKRGVWPRSNTFHEHCTRSMNREEPKLDPACRRARAAGNRDDGLQPTGRRNRRPKTKTMPGRPATPISASAKPTLTADGRIFDKRTSNPARNRPA